MSDYIKTADYAAKDALASGDLQKIVRGTELGADFDAIAVAIASKYDSTDLGVTLQQYSADTVVFASGTRLIFQQTNAPTGWTKVTTYNDAALRIVSGAVSSGGTDEFTTLFGAGKSTVSYTLTSADIPAHTHTFSGTTGTESATHTHTGTGAAPGGNWVANGSGQAPATAGSHTTSGQSANHTHSFSGDTGSYGSSGSHSHTLSNMNLKYVDCIIASKN